MKQNNQPYARIIATGSYLPKRILSNQDLMTMVDTSDEWIKDRTGVERRHIIDANETTLDMAYMAAIDTIANANIDLNDIDMIIVATISNNAIFPSCACLLQKKLGLKNPIPAFDINAACSGFLYALATANAYIKSQAANTILVIGVEAVSNFVDYTDRNTCILFGDGAGGVIVQKDANTGILAIKINADGDGAKYLNADAYIKNKQIIGNPYIYMDGKQVFKIAIKQLINTVNEILSVTNYTPQDIDWLIPHQANIRIIEATAKHLNIPMSKVIMTIHKHGNTSAASVPLALHDAVLNNKIQKNDLLLLEGFGAGFTWGSALIRF